LKLLHELVHEFLTKAQLPGMLLPFRPELEGVDDAHVEQPPRQTRPAATRFASRGRRGEKPAFGDLGEWREENRAGSIRAGDGDVAVRGRSQGGDAATKQGADRRRLHCGWSFCGGQGSVIRCPSCPCFRCCRGGLLRARAMEREPPRARNAERGSMAGATSALPGRPKQAMPAAGHCPRGARRAGEERATTWLACCHRCSGQRNGGRILRKVENQRRRMAQSSRHRQRSRSGVGHSTG